MVNANTLAARWNTSTQTLSNWRTLNRGLPAVVLPEGAVRYRIVEIVAAELAGTRGPLSVDRVALELSIMPDVPTELAVKIVARLRAAMSP